MSVYIRGMEMPNNCKECALYIDGACYGKGYRDYRSIMDTAKPDDCPLVEIPTPHGRLKDVDRIEYENVYFEDVGESYEIVGKDDIDELPTVIEAEGSET